MESPQKKKPGWKFALVALVAVLLPIIIVVSVAFYPYTWGEKGTLSLTISLDRSDMSARESLNASLVLKNTGSEKVRVLKEMPVGYFDVTLYDSQNRTVRCIKPMANYARVEPTYYNKYMVTLEPGATLTSVLRVGNHTTPSYDIQPNNTYRAVGKYYCYRVSGFGVLPHWAGTVYSESVYIAVK